MNIDADYVEVPAAAPQYKGRITVGGVEVWVSDGSFYKPYEAQGWARDHLERVLTKLFAGFPAVSSSDD